MNYFSALEDQASFRVKYDFTGPHYQKYHDVYRLHENKFALPKTWTAETGTVNVGPDYSRGEWTFYGKSFLFLSFFLIDFLLF